MAKTIFDADGNPVALPTSIADAKTYRFNHYDCGVECPKCRAAGFVGMVARKRYVSNDACVHCANLAALDLYENSAYPDVRRHVISNAHIYGAGVSQSMKDVEALFSGEVFPTSREAAKASGEKYFVTDAACKTRGHLGVRTLGGKCYQCESKKNELSPRQEAIRDGKKWYLPNEPCPKCDKVAEKRVDNGQCRGCSDTGPGDGRETSDSVMMRECPDLIITREDAKAAGLGVYRTGGKCRKGHDGFRYVSTGNCIDCLRG